MLVLVTFQGCRVLPKCQDLNIQLCLIWPTHLGSDLYPIQSSHHKFLYSLVLIKQLPNCPYPLSVSIRRPEHTWSSFLQASGLDKPDVSSQKADHRSAGASGSVDRWHQGRDRADLSSTPLILQPSMRDMHTIMVPYSAMTSTHARLYLVGSHCMLGSCHIIHPAGDEHPCCTILHSYRIACVSPLLGQAYEWLYNPPLKPLEWL